MEITKKKIPTTTDEKLGGSVTSLVADLAELVTLQIELIAADTKQLIATSKGGLMFLVAATLLGLGTVPIILALITAILYTLKVPLVASLLLSVLLGLGSCAFLVVFGVRKLKHEASGYSRSAEENRKNILWLKSLLREARNENS